MRAHNILPSRRTEILTIKLEARGVRPWSAALSPSFAHTKRMGTDNGAGPGGSDNERRTFPFLAANRTCFATRPDDATGRHGHAVLLRK